MRRLDEVDHGGPARDADHLSNMTFPADDDVRLVGCRAQVNSRDDIVFVEAIIRDENVKSFARDAAQG